MRLPYPTVASGEIGWATETDMVEVDRIMIDELRIELVQMMENAGRNLARLVLDLARPGTVTLLAGPGGNGGGGLVAARHLANHGVQVAVALTRPDLTGVPAHQLDILARMGVEVLDPTDPPRPADTVIDALLGYSLRGAPRGRAAELIGLAESLGPVVSLDTPSGLDVTTGVAPGDVVHAEATLTLALPKRGLRDAFEAGDLLVGDISVPPTVPDELGVGPPPDFSRSPILRITR